MRRFIADDGSGAELREEDVQELLDYYTEGDALSIQAIERIAAALAPKPAPTCGAVLEVDIYDRPCVLPPPVNGYHEGHHAWTRGNNEAEGPLAECQRWDWGGTCGKPESDPVHSPGHMVAQECWREP